MPNEEFSAFEVFGGMLVHGMRWGLLLGPLCGAVAGFSVFVIGAVFGLFLGPIVGLFAGGASGIAVAAISVTFYRSIEHKPSLGYRFIAALTCIFVTCIVAYSFTQNWFSNGSGMAGFIFLPASLAAIYSSQHLATWYIEYLNSLVGVSAQNVDE